MDPTTPRLDDDRRERLHLLWCIAIGLGAAVVGLLPWLVHGMRLPLQNLWATPTLPDAMPIVLLPFSQYAVTLLLGLLGTGYAVAGVAARALRARLPRRGALVIVLTVVVVHLLAAVQTTVVVLGGLADRSASDLYVAAVLSVIAFGVALGVVAFRLIARAHPAWASVGLALGALALGLWCSGLIAPLGAPAGAVQSWLLGSVLRWLPAALTGAAIAWAGVSTAGRIAAAVGNLLLLWIAPAAFTAVSAAAGSRVLLPYPGELADYAHGVFRLALLEPAVVLPPLLVAALVAAAGLGARRLIGGPRTA